MIIVPDSSALIALSICDSLWLLERLFGEVKIPPAVFHEVIQHGKPQSQSLRSYCEGKITAVKLNPVQLEKAKGLGRGELEAIALYLELSAELLLIDDAKARKIAVLNYLEVMGSLGVLLLAKQEHLVERISPLIASLNASNIYLSQRLITQALELAGET
ncbi:MAG: hypothetical protein BWK78_07435 [Thiotrichaceae bacterium IS1]|nr:MAG: hypothetical protein BWK78_07435 [Thiotrichaceae bacterium IS1]